MIHIFAGYDEREAVGYHTFCASVIKHSTELVTITPLSLQSIQHVYTGGQRDGTNAFIYSRFLIPYLMGFRGWALFVDGSDMIVKDDIAKLWAQRNIYKAVQVVQHNYKTKHPRKYVGTDMEADNNDYVRKQWSSVMLINCSHYSWRQMTPKAVEEMPGAFLHRFSFIEDRYIGELPIEWNWLCQEHGENPEAKLIHYTAGIPKFPAYKDCPMAKDWFEANEFSQHATS